MKRERSRRKTALVTGGARGIGKAIVQELANNDFAVIINYNKSRKPAAALERLLIKQNKECFFVKADISKRAEVEKMTRAIKRRFKSLDALINNAGIIYDKKDQKLENLNWEEYENTLNTNLTGALMTTKSLLPLLKKSRHPRVVFIASSLAFIGSRRRFAYVVSKAGIVGAVRALAMEMAPDILVNAAVPGYIKTRMANFSKKELAEKLKKIPLKRLGTPEETAKLVSFLASPQNTYITGQCIHINGGLFFS